MVAVVASMLEVLELASVLVPCRAALHPRLSVYGPHIQMVRRLCPRHCVVWSVRVILIDTPCPLVAAHIPARRCRVLSASLCPVRRNRPRYRSIPLWSALVRSCQLRLHFNDTTRHLNQQGNISQITRMWTSEPSK